MIDGNQVPLIASFTAGIMTFISPCILPIIPAYISFITGASLEDLSKGTKPGVKVMLTSVFFILGFSLIFILLGASASYLGGFISGQRAIIQWVGGLIVIMFGLHIAGILNIKFLYIEKRLKLGNTGIGYTGAFLIGIAFAIGWTPCVGPILSSILILASVRETVGQGTMLLAAYSAGIAVPFLLTSLFINWSLKLFEKIKKFYGVIELVSGLILVAVGILIISGGLNRLTGYIMNAFGM